MTLEAVVQGKSHKIKLEALPDESYRIDLDGMTYKGDVEALPGGAYSLIIEGRQYELYLDEGPEGFEIELNGYRYPVELVDPRRRAAGGGLGGKTGKIVIKSSMPGKVIKLLVEEGERVEANTGVIVLEAMKMQNELKTPKPGTVEKIHVVDGSKVEANAPLLVIDVKAD